MILAQKNGPLECDMRVGRAVWYGPMDAWMDGLLWGYCEQKACVYNTERMMDQLSSFWKHTYITSAAH